MPASWWCRAFGCQLHLHTVVGPSMGGMTTLAFAIAKPGHDPQPGADFHGCALAAIFHRDALAAAGDDPP
jgi:hypothetical protein